VSASVLHSPATTVLAVIPGIVIWSYSVGAVVLAAWLATTVRRGDWSRARGFDRAILLGPVFYAVPLAAFGTEHFTLAGIIASLIPGWIPWHQFWTYLLGACFIAAALSLVTGIQTRLAASLLAGTFLLFVLLMDVPAWAEDPRDRFALTLALRQLAFSGGALALAASLTPPDRKPGPNVLATIARYFVAVPVVVFGFQQFMHGDHVPGVPLKRLTPDYVLGHSLWTYLAAIVYVLAGALLLAGKRTRAAATWIGLTVLLVVLAVYVPIAVVDRASLGNGLNYLFDTLMFCGVAFLLAGAMPREEWQREPSAKSLQASG
jgi:uncharacterized membrane protein YphA (DoxX/SURF4 family)